MLAGIFATLQLAVGSHSRAPLEPAHPKPGADGASAQTSALATYPFVPPPELRTPTVEDQLPSLYDDGSECSQGCRPAGAVDGWPLQPFDSQHAIRAGIDELRPAGFHVGLDIQARDGAKVFAVQPGAAIITQASGDTRVQVGNYIYWHVHPLIAPGTQVQPYAQPIGTVMSGFGHIAFSELGSHGQYLNPLRPGGRVLNPWSDQKPPVIGFPQLTPDGQATVAAFGPQSFLQQTTYRTPVLSVAGLAWRLYDSHGQPVTDLEWTFRATQLLGQDLVSKVFTPGARAPGFGCFASRPVCIPNWTYKLAGTTTPTLPSGVGDGTYRLAIYAWDWADNRSALDVAVARSGSSWSSLGPWNAAPAVAAVREVGPRA